MNNQLAKVNPQTKVSFGAYMTSAGVKNRINEIIGNEETGKRFISSIVSAVSTNPSLSECDNGSIVSGALLGETLKLSPSPQLGNYYLVPFNVKRKVKDSEGKEKEISVKEAQFQLGYKGYIQLAIRSGQYKKLNVLAIKEGELIKYDPLEEEIEVNLIDDEEKREKATTIGYYAMFEYTNGFRKTMYWSKQKMEAHALQYSTGYKNDKKNKTAYTFWSKDFDGMAYKTMLRQLISKWGIMSIDMQQAFESDMAVIKEDGSKVYVDNQEDVPDAIFEEKTTKGIDEL